MLFGFFMGDWTLILLVAAMIFALVAQFKVKSTFNKYNRINNSSGLSGAEAARRILDSNGLYHVRVEFVRGQLTDHYDPRQNVVRLSESTYNSRSVAAVGVAAHEAGHAVQYAENYAPIRLRTAIIPATSIGSKLSMPLILIGILLTSFSYDPTIGLYAMLAGIVLFSISTFFQLVTLPVEFNASKRAMKALKEHRILVGRDIAGARATLSAAAMTYVAALATSLAYLLRYILIFMGASGRRRN